MAYFGIRMSFQGIPELCCPLSLQKADGVEVVIALLTFCRLKDAISCVFLVD